MTRINSKAALIARAYIWFYRILGLTFGGVSIDSENKLFVNKYLKYYGFLCCIVATLHNITVFIIFATSDEILVAYKYGQVMAYWVVILTNLLLIFQITVNLWYLNLNGMKFVEIFVQYDMNIGKNQIIIFIIWICHIIIPFVRMLYYLYTSKMIINSSSMIVMIFWIFKLCGFFGVWAVPFLSWILSIHFFEFLKGIKQTLTEKLNSNNTGIYFTSKFFFSH
jgi:hypothetical protein